MPTICRFCHVVSRSRPSLSSERTVVAGEGAELAMARPVSESTFSMSGVCVRVMFPSDVVVKVIPRKV